MVSYALFFLKIFKNNEKKFYYLLINKFNLYHMFKCPMTHLGILPVKVR